MFGQALIYTLMVVLLGRTKGKTADSFIAGGRNIGHGMIHNSIIATWIWAATLMMSSWTGYSYGISGGWWYGLGATIPLPLMAYICRRTRLDMPEHRSYPEYIRFRLDRKNQILQAIITIIVCGWVTLMLVTGGAIMLVAFTGASFYWMSLRHDGDLRVVRRSRRSLGQHLRRHHHVAGHVHLHRPHHLSGVLRASAPASASATTGKVSTTS